METPLPKSASGFAVSLKLFGRHQVGEWRPKMGKISNFVRFWHRISSTTQIQPCMSQISTVELKKRLFQV